jgi:hypothetical protein
VIVLAPSASCTLGALHVTTLALLLMLAMPDPPLSLTQVTRMTCRLSVAEPDTLTVFCDTVADVPVVGAVIVNDGRMLSRRDSA